MRSMGIFSLAVVAMLGIAPRAQGKVIGTNVIAQPVTAERIEQLPAVQRRAWREYLSRSVQQKIADKERLAGELKFSGRTVSNAAPAGHSAKMTDATHPAEWYASDEALTLAQNVISYQLPDGGWSKNIDMGAHARAPGDRYDTDNLNRFPDATDFDAPVDPHWHYLATLDNDATWSQLNFLARVDAALNAGHSSKDLIPVEDSIQRGVQYLLDAQYPNGGWPQVWPLEGGYHDAITINDNAMLHAIEILRDAGDGAPGFEFLSYAMRHRAAAAADHGMECLLQLQVKQNGKRTAWAQQYDAINLQPTSARNYEMPSLSSGESAAIVEFLMKLPRPSTMQVRAVYAAAAWFKQTEIFGYRFGSGNYRTDRSSADGRMRVAAPGAGPIWSRYYQLGTDLPIFGDRDKSIHDDVNEISKERRNGYAWYNGEGVAVLADFEAWSKRWPMKP